MVTRIAAGNGAGRCFAKDDSASTPPAEVPVATMSRLAMASSVRVPGGSPTIKTSTRGAVLGFRPRASAKCKHTRGCARPDFVMG
jgi:hypothetical protein